MAAANAAAITSLQTEVTSLQASVTALQSSVSTLSSSAGNYLTTGDANSFYLVIVGVFVFFMQAGFALLEAGSVRAKNTKNILMKNLLDACIGAVIWWSWGYGIAYDKHGPNDADGNMILQQGFIGYGVGDNVLGSFFA